MSLSFPLSIADFFGGLRVAEARPLHLPDVRQTSRTRGGEVISAAVGNRLWTGAFTLARGYHGPADAVAAKLDRLTEPDGSFFVRPLGRNGPIADPEGLALSGAGPKIHELPQNQRMIRIGGLPSGFYLQPGDFLSFQYGASPVRYAFHRVVKGGVAASGGITAPIEVMPPIRPGAVTGVAVVLVNPFFKAIVTSASHGSRRPLISEGASFEFIQTLR